MNGKEYIARVTASLHRAKPGEREDIARELEAHLEDHRAALMDLGWTEEEADERAAETMGDPEETARALDAQFSEFWGFMEYLGQFLALTAAILVISFTFDVWDIRDDFGWLFRAYPEDAPKGNFEYQEVSVRVNTGYDRLWVYSVAISPTRKEALVYYNIYDLDPFGNLSEPIHWRADPWGKYTESDLIWAQTPDGNWKLCNRGRWNIYGDQYARGVVSSIPVEEGQDHIDLRYDRLGDIVEFRVPIDGEVWE